MLHALLLDSVCLGGDDKERTREGNGEWVIIASTLEGGGRPLVRGGVSRGCRPLGRGATTVTTREEKEMNIFFKFNNKNRFGLLL